MEWTSEQPTTIGFYWCWSPGYPCGGRVRCVEVYIGIGRGKVLVATVPDMDYSEKLVGRRQGDDWEDCLWQGPIEAPQPPDKHRRWGG